MTKAEKHILFILLKKAIKKRQLVIYFKGNLEDALFISTNGNAVQINASLDPLKKKID